MREPAAIDQGDNGPIHQLPPGLKIVCPAVLVLEVIGVLPDVESEQGSEAFGEGIACVGALGYEELAVVVLGEPYPSGAEEADAGVDKGAAEVLEAAEVAVDGLAQLSFGHASAVGAEGEEVEDFHSMDETGSLADFEEDFADELEDEYEEGSEEESSDDDEKSISFDD